MPQAEKCEGCRKDKKSCVSVPGDTRCKRCIEKGRPDCERKWPGPRNPAPGEAVAGIGYQSNSQQYPAYQQTTTQAFLSTNPVAIPDYAGLDMTDSYQGYSGIPGMNWSSGAANSLYEQGFPHSPDSALSFDSENKEETMPLQGSLKKLKQKQGWPQQ